jgi:hypothetical protein
VKEEKPLGGVVMGWDSGMVGGRVGECATRPELWRGECGRRRGGAAEAERKASVLRGGMAPVCPLPEEEMGNFGVICSSLSSCIAGMPPLRLPLLLPSCHLWAGKLSSCRNGDR